MIAQIEGKLLKLDSGSALVQVGQIAYEVMLPGYCVAALSGKIGSEITLCTMEYYEGAPGAGSLVPRMVGFLSSAEKDFFTKFISVKGIGIKKGLRFLSIPIAAIALAIEDGDEKTLLSLPSVGRRMAQQIIAELKGKSIKDRMEALIRVAHPDFRAWIREEADRLKIVPQPVVPVTSTAMLTTPRTKEVSALPATTARREIGAARSRPMVPFSFSSSRPSTPNWTVRKTKRMAIAAE